MQNVQPHRETRHPMSRQGRHRVFIGKTGETMKGVFSASENPSLIALHVFLSPVGLMTAGISAGI